MLNPPYSAPGNGLVFVKKAFEMMNQRGKSEKYGAVIIQDSAGSGKAFEYCLDILKQATLVASIKMPADLFIGKSGVQTSIYVFKVGTPHDKNKLVKFIDFRNDGYKRFLKGVGSPKAVSQQTQNDLLALETKHSVAGWGEFSLKALFRKISGVSVWSR